MDLLPQTLLIFVIVEESPNIKIQLHVASNCTPLSYTLYPAYFDCILRRTLLLSQFYQVIGEPLNPTLAGPEKPSISTLAQASDLDTLLLLQLLPLASVETIE